MRRGGFSLLPRNVAWQVDTRGNGSWRWSRTGCRGFRSSHQAALATLPFLRSQVVRLAAQRMAPIVAQLDVSPFTHDAFFQQARPLQSPPYLSPPPPGTPPAARL